MRTSLANLRGTRRVLVIDDDDVVRETMVELLKKAGHTVYSLPSPIGATKAILDMDVDVVVLDVMMPSLRGDTLATLLNRNPRLVHLSVVLVSSASPAELARLASSVRASSVVQKANLHSELELAVRGSSRA